MMQASYRISVLAGCVLAQLVIACSSNNATAVNGDGLHSTRDTVGVPLMDLGNRTYLGFAGGLYEGGNNSPLEDHASVGAARARNIQPRDANGTPSPGGKIVLLSIGMSNTSQEFCGVNVTVNCVPGSFMQQ